MSLEDMGADQSQQKRLLEELNAGQNLLKKEREEVKVALAQLSVYAGDAAALKTQGAPTASQ